jgi:hypothetical protein
MSGSFRPSNIIGVFQMAGLGDLIDASPGGWSDHNCAVRASGQVVCWSPPHFSKTLWDVPLALHEVPGLADVRGIAATSDGACALSADDGVACWGRSAVGKLGSGVASIQPVPVEVRDLAGARRIVADRSHSCALLSDGRIRCWGDEKLPWSGMSALHGSDCASRGGHLSCWDGSHTSEVTLSGIVDVIRCQSQNSTCHYARLSSGRVVRIDAPQPGDAGAPSPVVRRVEGIEGAQGLTGGFFETCALVAREVLCWERAAPDALPPDVERPAFTRTPRPADVVQIGTAAQRESTCALLGSGSVLCWEPKGEPREIPGLADATQLAMGDEFTCALRRSGRVACWGHGYRGQLGDGTLVNRPEPGEVLGLSDARALAAGDTHVCALRAGGKVSCWGDDQTGAVGTGNPTEVKDPARVAAPTSEPLPR